MLPASVRDRLFDWLSVQTMRYVDATPTREATGLTEQVYRMVAEEFFINGAITSHSAVPELMAGMWCGGRESVLVGDQIDRATKEAMANVLSTINGCPYCEDMTVSLVQAAGRDDLLTWTGGPGDATDPVTADEPLVHWAEAVATGAWDAPFPCGIEAFPEAVGTVLTFSYIPRFSHVVMDGSPVDETLIVGPFKNAIIRFFSHELRLSLDETLEPGRPLELLPVAEPPPDLAWAAANPRVEEAHARWRAGVERHANRSVPAPVRETVERRMADWRGETMPLSRSWVEEEVDHLEPVHRDLARFGLLVALAPYQVDDNVVQPVLGDGDQARFVRTLAWAAMVGARRIAVGIANENSDLLPDAAAPPAVTVR